MTEDKFDALLSYIDKIETDLSHVKADLKAIRGSVVIAPDRQTKEDTKELQKALIIAKQYKIKKLPA
ncbi:hypothetical protein CLU96_1281 [Chryseobacterium sp. 52]|uniref:hypothetical protein n=1 Tax=Chryseobacterium sp. 52 TaxID=2035213 RepID=UPI000C193722|nr:hypothetical protein [Chryseobacterium sp. 52]PIF44337.1 hypothetical protein CLU96_1281 [Chryseobacterium sp. 52]